MAPDDPISGSSRGIWFWLLAAPAAVVLCLLLFHNVFAVFSVYHLGFCLVLPAVNKLLRGGFTVRGHSASLALTGPHTLRGLGWGLALGTILASATILAFRWFGDLFLADQNVPAVLATWGVTPANLPLMFWFMTLINAPAEELYWRGFVHTELAGRRPRSTTIGLIATCYASYHGLTVYLLVGNIPVALLFMTAILGAGLAWGWLREKTGSVWPALLGHAGATAAYMIVARPLLEG